MRHVQPAVDSSRQDRLVLLDFQVRGFAVLFDHQFVGTHGGGEAAAGGGGMRVEMRGVWLDLGEFGLFVEVERERGR